jgi:hypothetical protein
VRLEIGNRSTERSLMPAVGRDEMSDEAAHNGVWRSASEVAESIDASAPPRDDDHHQLEWMQ